MGSRSDSDFVSKRIFISYGHDEPGKQLSKKLKASLEELGHRVWLDESEIKVGHDWEVAIEKGLSTTDVVLALLTPHAVRRPGGVCLDELGFARFRSKRIVPLMVEECQPPLSISRIQWLDMRDWANSEGRYESKLRLIRDVIEGRLLCFEGSQAALLDTLRPIAFDADIHHYASGFLGREWVFAKIEDWLYDGRASQVFLLTADAGVGKSAIAARICQKHPRVFGWHFCVHGDSTKSDALKCVQSLAYQLSTQLPDYRQRLLAIKLAEDANARTAFVQLIVNPLHNLGSPASPILIVVDAIDEATRDGKNEMADFLAKVFELTPPWLRLLVTSRPETPIVNTFSRFYHWDIQEDDCSENLEDIHRFLERELNQIAETPASEATMRTILERSEGVFLYVVLVLEEISRGRLSLDRLHDFPIGLRAIYGQYFDRCFSDDDPDTRALKETDYNTYQRPLLELVTAAQEPLSVGLISSTLGWDKRSRKLAIDPLGSLFKRAKEHFVPFHRSILDWLTDERTEVRYFIDRANGHVRLASAGWAQFKAAPAAMDNYFGFYLPSHLLATGRTIQLLDFLSNIDVFVRYFRGNINRYVGYWTAMYRLEGKEQWGLKDYAKILTENLKTWENASTECQRNWQAHWSLGRLFFELHEYERAVELYKRALSSLSSHSPSDERLAQVYNGIGESYKQLDRMADAEPFYRDALEIRKRTPEDRASLAESTNNYGHVMYSQGSYDRALDQYRQALEIWRQVPNGPHYGVADSLHNVAVSLDSLGRQDEAIVAFKQCAEALDSLVYFDWGIPICRTQYGNFLIKLGKLDEAERQYRLAYELCMNTCGPEDESTIDCAKHLGLLYFYRGQPEKAIPQLQEVADASKRHYDESHPKTIQILYLLGEILMREQRTAEAKDVFADAADRIGKSKTRDTLYFNSQASVARNLRLCGKWETAEEIYREIIKEGEKLTTALETQSTSKDDRIFQLAVAYNEVAFHSFVPQEKWEEAKTFYRRAIDLMSMQGNDLESANMRLNLFTAMWRSGADIDPEEVEKQTYTLENAGDPRAEKGRTILRHRLSIKARGLECSP